MSGGMEWSLDFCLVCDRQTDGGIYCGESCRLAEYDKANSGSTASSPASTLGAGSWPTRSVNSFFLQPALDFQSFKSRASQRPQASAAFVSKPLLTPSSSQSSLFSMQSASTSSSEPYQVSEEARRELRAYASSFDQSRYQRRQSTY